MGKIVEIALESIRAQLAGNNEEGNLEIYGQLGYRIWASGGNGILTTLWSKEEDDYITIPEETDKYIGQVREITMEQDYYLDVGGNLFEYNYIEDNTDFGVKKETIYYDDITPYNQYIEVRFSSDDQLAIATYRVTEIQ